MFVSKLQLLKFNLKLMLDQIVYYMLLIINKLCLIYRQNKVMNTILFITVIYIIP